MRKSFIVIDDFLDNFNDARAAALSADYSDYPFAGEIHHGSAFDSGDFPWDKMQEAIGEEISPIISFYRSHTENTEFDENHWIHADAISPRVQWAAVVYLTNEEPDAMNGTATFKHLGLGVRSCPGVDVLESAGFRAADVLNMLESDGSDAKRWKMSEFAQLVPNRCVIYPARSFHGRFPYKAFGDGVGDSRLIWVAFAA